jgi:hypothetical protein
MDKKKQRLLREAAQLVGREELAVRLKIAATELDAWMQGSISMPDRKLLALAGILDKLAAEKHPFGR